MADNTLATKADLAALTLRVIRRTGATPMENETDNIIRLAEAGLNRELPAVESDNTLTGVVNSRRIDITAIPIERPVSLFVTVGNYDREVRPSSDGTLEYNTIAGEPRAWALDGTRSYIDLDRPCDQAYSMRFRSIQRYSLAADGDTNWLLTKHPDVYLAACVVWGYARMEDVPNAAQWSQQLDSGIKSVRSELANLKRGVLVSDPAIQMLGRRRYFHNIYTGS